MPDANFLQDVNQDQGDNRLSGFMQQYLKNKGRKLSPYEEEKIKRLTSAVGSGVEGLSYLTGQKKPQVETFYDKHPGQATLRDTANSLPAVGAGIAAGGSLLSIYRDKKLKDKLKGVASKLDAPEKGIPSVNIDATERKEAPFLDEIHGIFGEQGSHRRNNMFPPDMDPEKARKTLGGYSRFYSAAHKLRGELPRHDDERLARTLSSELPSFVSGTDKAPPHIPLITNMLESLLGGDTERAERVGQKIQGYYMPPKKPLPGGFKPSANMKRVWTNVKKPGAIGGATALAGLGLAPILHMIHRKMYGDDKVKDWTNATKMTKGKFNNLEQ